MWLRLPTLISLPASLDLASDLKSLSQRLAASVTSRSKFMPPAYWLRVLKTGAFPTLLSGVTSEPSTVNRGMDEWIASLADSPVPTSASPEKQAGIHGEHSGLWFEYLRVIREVQPELWSLSKTSLQYSLFQREEPHFRRGLPDAGSDAVWITFTESSEVGASHRPMA